MAADLISPGGFTPTKGQKKTFAVQKSRKSSTISRKNKRGRKRAKSIARVITATEDRRQKVCVNHFSMRVE